MKRAIVGVLVISLGLLLKSCDTTDPPPPPPDGEKPTLALALDDASCTEAWLQLTTKDLELPAELTLKQYNPTGDSLSKIFLLNTQDSLLYVDSLLPNQTYTFHTAIQSSSHTDEVKSNVLSVTTLDTTSHDFTFETWTFGTVGSSTLYDVAIINENNIWAVGGIMIADTSINGYTMYNAVHWDGSEWELKRIMFYTICGQQNRTAYPASSIFAFSENDIWIAMDGDQIARLENNVQTETRCLPWSFSIKKIWGSSSNDLYVVGNNGNIVHYNGTLWTRIESGTVLNINDIWGDYHDKTGEWEILAVASNVNTSIERTIIKIYNNSSKIISSSPMQWSLRTVWFLPSRRYYVAGSGIYEKHNLTENEWLNNPLDITTFYTNRVRGNEINDVVGVGAFGDFVHFNGTGWKVSYQNPKLNFGSYLSLDIKENIVAAVGLEYNQAVILIASKINQ